MINGVSQPFYKDFSTANLFALASDIANFATALLAFVQFTASLWMPVVRGMPEFMSDDTGLQTLRSYVGQTMNHKPPKRVKQTAEPSGDAL